MSRALDAVESTGRERRGLGLQVLSFALTGALIYFCGMKTVEREHPEQSPPPCAVVVLRMARSSDAVLAQEQAKLESTLFSDASLSSSLAELPDGGGAILDPAKLRVTLALTLGPGAAADECRATIVNRVAATGASVAMVNSLARRCADAWQARHRSISQSRHAAAKEAASRGRQALAEARANLAGFLDRHFQELETLAQEPATATSLLELAAGGTTDEGPRLVDNPQWQAVWQEVMSLRHALLARRGSAGPLSPEGQRLQSRIAELEQQLGRLPRKIPAAAPEPALRRVPPTDAPSAQAATLPPERAASQPSAPELPSRKVVREQPRKSTEEQLQLVGVYHKLCAAVEHAVTAEARLAQAEREAWQDQQREPVVALLLAGVPPPHTIASPVARLFWIAVAAATAVACGVGMISSGARREPLLETPEQVRRATTLPMFGVIRESNLPDEPQRVATRRADAGWWLSAGLALIVCTAISVAMVIGKG